VDLPAGCTYRPATPDDVADCCALVIAVDCEEYGAPDYEEADVREDWARERFDLDRDTWLVHDDKDNLIGYAAAHDRRPGTLLQAEVFAHPEGPDLYPWLVDAVGSRAYEHAAGSGSTTAHVFNSEPNTRRATALANAGYDVVRVFRRMVIDLAAPPPAPDDAPGVSVRKVTPDDLPTCWEISQASFAEHFDFVPGPYDEWRARLVDTETYRPEYWWLADVDGVPSGVLVGQRHEADGWVKTLGVLPSARGRGAGTALLLTALAAFRADGAPKVGLGVDSANTSGAMALYERIGMRAEQRYDCYERVFTRS
jgi:ribosomal protein S18 acetylase RimI-like enzyme